MVTRSEFSKKKKGFGFPLIISQRLLSYYGLKD